MADFEKPSLPRSLYIHVPFCRHRCGYCNFTLVAGRDHLVDDYLQAIEIEMAGLGAEFDVRPVMETIYLGGGTPSRLSGDALTHLLGLTARYFEFDSRGEFTIEANPDDLPGEVAEVVDNSPINRVSLGVQSFNLRKLRSLDRDHNQRQIEDALTECRSIVDRFSIDLIFSAPGEDLQTWEADLAKAIGCGASHLSTYELTYEKGTRFWNRMQRGEPEMAECDSSSEFYEGAISSLTAAGFEHYEVSSFARPGNRSRHNQTYWNGSDYLAIGPGASGLYSGARYTNHRSVSRYLKKVLAGEAAMEESRNLSREELAMERIVFGLRVIEGIDLPRFVIETGFELTEIADQKMLRELADQQLIEWTSERLKLTRRGLMFGDHVCSTVLNSMPQS